MDTNYTENYADEEIFNQISQLNNELVNSQRDLVKKNKLIQSQSERFRATIESISDILIVIDNNSKISFVNSITKKFLCLTEDELIGRDINELMLLETENGERKDILSTFHPLESGMIQEYELVLNVPCKKNIYVELTISPVLSAENIPEGSVVVIRDITQRKKMEKKQAEMNELMMIINRILRHDIANDLNAMRLSSHLFQEKKDPEYMTKLIQKIEKSIALIKRMSDLDAVLLQGGVDLTPYAVKDVIEDIIDHYDIDYTIEGNSLVMVDAAFSSVMDNIIRNAIMHGNATYIHISIVDNGKLCDITIADNGVGIPDDIKDKIFNQNFTYGKNAHTGLGLYIVKKVIERYGGEISIRDNVPQGAAFTIKLNKFKG